MVLLKKVSYTNSQYILVTCFSIIACGRFLVSDTILPKNFIQVAQDHILYDGRKIIFLQQDINDQKEFPSSISGRETYSYDALSKQTGIVEGEYILLGGNYYIIRLENKKLIKVPSEDFLLVTDFIIEKTEVNGG